MSEGGAGGLDGLFAQAKQMQEKMARLQRELATRRVEGAAGGGLVTAVVSGELRVLELRIDPKLLEAPDRELLQDLSAAAVNAALEAARRMVQEEMQRAAGPLPGLLGNLPGLG